MPAYCKAKAALARPAQARNPKQSLSPPPPTQSCHDLPPHLFSSHPTGNPPHPHAPAPRTIEGDSGLGGVAPNAPQHHRVLVLHRLRQLDLRANALQQAQQELGAPEALLVQGGVGADGPAGPVGGCACEWEGYFFIYSHVLYWLQLVQGA